MQNAKCRMQNAKCKIIFQFLSPHCYLCPLLPGIVFDTYLYGGVFLCGVTIPAGYRFRYPCLRGSVSLVSGYRFRYLCGRGEFYLSRGYRFRYPCLHGSVSLVVRYRLATEGRCKRVHQNKKNTKGSPFGKPFVLGETPKYIAASLIS